MEWNILAALIVPAVLSLLLTPLIIRFAKRIGAIDLPNERKVHKQPMPRLGGLSIFLSFLLSFLLFKLAGSSVGVLDPWREWTLVSAVLAVLLLGIADDIRPLRPGPKFLVQALAASLIYVGGVRVSTVTGFPGFGPVATGLLDFPVTLLWIVGVTNAFNLIDGLDGLAAGVGVIASATVAAVSFLNNDMRTAVVACALAGALIGFLRYNFNPARIFLGDSGSLLVGFLLAILSVGSSTKGSTAFVIVVPVLALGLPIMDTFVAMTRRFLGTLVPDRRNRSTLLGKFSSMFLPDRKHIHHQLVSLGFSHRRVVLLLYLISCLFGAAAFAVTVSNNVGASLILVCIGIATVTGIRQLHYREMAVLKNGVFLPIYDAPFIQRSLFLGFLDLAFIAISFVAASAVFPVKGAQEIFPGFRAMVPIVCGIQLTLFLTFGLYRGTFRFMGVGDVLHTLKAVLLSAVVSSLVFVAIPVIRAHISLPLLLLDAYILLTFVLLARISFPILHYFFRRGQQNDQHVLVYGAAANGMIVLQHVLNDPTWGMTPLGFLDDAPQLEGKIVNGYPVFGGHWKIPALARKFKIDQILLACDTMKPETLRRLRQWTREHGIALKRPRLLLEEVVVPEPSHDSGRMGRDVVRRHIAALALSKSNESTPKGQP